MKVAVILVGSLQPCTMKVAVVLVGSLQPEGYGRFCTMKVAVVLVGSLQPEGYGRFCTMKVAVVLVGSLQPDCAHHAAAQDRIMKLIVGSLGIVRKHIVPEGRSVPIFSVLRGANTSFVLVLNVVVLCTSVLW